MEYLICYKSQLWCPRGLWPTGQFRNRGDAIFKTTVRNVLVIPLRSHPILKFNYGKSEQCPSVERQRFHSRSPYPKSVLRPFTSFIHNHVHFSRMSKYFLFGQTFPPMQSAGQWVLPTDSKQMLPINKPKQAQVKVKRSTVLTEQLHNSTQCTAWTPFCFKY